MSVRIALLDSGVHATHPHITRPVCGGITTTPDGENADFADMLGHGTAVCALVQAMAPDADIFSVRIFDRRLATTASTVLRGIEWCVRNRIDIINLSLGTTNANHAPAFLQAIRSVQGAGAVLVSAAEVEGTAMLPGSLPGVVGVVEDAACPREDVRVQNLGATRFAACPFPLDIAGVPRERNLRGVSFSVAHVSAAIARHWHSSGPQGDWASFLQEQVSRHVTADETANDAASV